MLQMTALVFFLSFEGSRFMKLTTGGFLMKIRDLVAIAALILLVPGLASAATVSTLSGAEGKRVANVLGDPLDTLTTTFFGRDTDLEFTGPGNAFNRVVAGGSDENSWKLNPGSAFDILFRAAPSSRKGSPPVSVLLTGTDGAGGPALFNTIVLATATNPINSIVFEDLFTTTGDVRLTITGLGGSTDVDSSVSTVPLAGGLIFLFSGLVGLYLFSRRRRPSLVAA